MKDYRNFEAVEFAQDDQFFKWVKHPALYPELDRFWRRWIDENPDRSNEVEEARKMIIAILDEGEAVHVSSRQDAVLTRIRQSIGEQPIPKKEVPWKRIMKIAAALVVVLSVGLYYFIKESAPSTLSNSGWEGEMFIKEINNGQTPKTIFLGDGSSIVLQPNSILQYPKTFDNTRREVVLIGEGFFEVSKDANRPFLVYADKVLTKVLGTSFTIRAYAGEKDVLVKVRTGKVSVVQRSRQEITSDTELSSEGVLLTPNQQVVFEKEASRFVKSLVKEPQILNSLGSGDFTFEDTPVNDVFTLLEGAYGVNIVYDEELMRECLINGSLEEMTLYDKLRLICKSINATYELVDSHVVISGHGCKDQ